MGPVFTGVRPKWVDGFWDVECRCLILLRENVMTRRLIQAMTASDSFEVMAYLNDSNQVEPLFRRNTLKAALVIPSDFGRRLSRGEPTEAQLLLDGADGVTTSIAMGYAAGISQAEVVGGAEREILVRPDQVKLRLYGLDVEDLATALRTARCTEQGSVAGAPVRARLRTPWTTRSSRWTSEREISRGPRHSSGSVPLRACRSIL